MKKVMITMLMLSAVLLLINGCTSGNTSECRGEFPEAPGGSCPEGQTVQYTKDEQGCFTQRQCGDALPVDEAAGSDCLARCDETGQPEGDAFAVNSYNYCKAACHSQRAASTKNSTDCKPILDSARQYSEITLSGGLYNLYFNCVVNDVGITDPAACDVVRGDTTTYPYCIIKVAVKANDPTLCDLTKSEADTANYYYNQCLREVNN